MSGTARSSEGLDARRRKLLFRSWHRGIREMDLILGGFADAAIATLTDAELDQYEHLLELQDADLSVLVHRRAVRPCRFRHAIAEEDHGLPRRGDLKNDFMSLLEKIGLPKGRTGQFIVDGVADGFEAFALASAAAEAAPDGPLLFVARDGQRLPAIIEALAFVAPDLPVLEFPAWDCLPYDRVSPGSDAAARRLDALSAMAALRREPAPRPHPHHRQRAAPAHPAGRGDRGAGLPRQAGQQHQHERADFAAGNLRLRARADRARCRRVRRARRHPRPLRAGRRGGGPARFLRRHAGDHPRLRCRDPAHHRHPHADLAAADDRGHADTGHDQPLPPQLHRGVRRAVARRRPLRRDQRGPPLRRHGALAALLLRAARHAVRLSARRACRLRPSRA